MRYRDVVSFEPIESVVQLRQADEAEKARELVRTYVISDRMAEQMAEVIVPQLQFERPGDNRGLLILGNYGTGKSHLMSLLSAVAERAELVEAVNHPGVQDALSSVAGKFTVKRVELGAVEGSLRDKILGALEEAFADWGAPYTFPDAAKITNNKDPLIAAMADFHEKHPNKGVLLVVDELLDFLRSQHEQALIRDLAFLRELGEVTALTPFRFMAGLQEMLFDNPRFQFVAEQLNRVRDRFEQVSIAREDIAFVVSERLLKKDDEQKARIAAHLQTFTPLYANMSERMDEHVRLFPIHPAYLDTFQNVRIAEKREVLRTFSAAIRDLLDKDVPAGEPGTISYDHYYDLLQANKALRSIPEVSQVMDKSAILAERVDTAYQKVALKPMARRIVKGLAVHRLTTDDITDPIGATPEELRDNLGLYVKTPEVSADFLGDQVRVALNDIMKTVNGQYITHDQATDQYYLDVEKDIDFETHLRDKADALSPDEINRAYFNVLVQMLDYDSSSAYTRGFRIWLDDVPWEAKRVTRPGYFFLGEPSTRSTAEPARDFYVYFMPEFTGRREIPETVEDEVVFSLTNIDVAFQQLVRDYAAASIEAAGSATHRETYRNIAEHRLRNLRRWIDERLLEHLQVTYQGVTQPAGKALGASMNTAAASLADVIKRIAGAKLAPYFEERYPEYPAFSGLSAPVTEASRERTAEEAVRMIATGNATRQAKAVLNAFNLLDQDDRIRSVDSPYAAAIRKALEQKSPGQVVNRGELIESIAIGILRPIEKDRLFRLEPEWIAVILAAMVRDGQIVLTLDKNEAIDASTIDRLGMMPLERLAHFHHFGRPKEVPIENWKAIFEGFGLPPGLVGDTNRREQAVKDLQIRVQAAQTDVAEIVGRLSPKLTLWNMPVFNDNVTFEAEKGAIIGSNTPESPLFTTELLPDIRGYKQFLEELSKFNTPGKLQNLRLSSADVASAHKEAKTLDRARQLLQTVDSLQVDASYLAQGAEILPSSDDWQEQANATRSDLLLAVRKFGRGENSLETLQAINRRISDLRKSYADRYVEAHQMSVLGPAEDDRKKELLSDPRISALKELGKLELLSKNRTDLDGWQQALSNLRSCLEFHPGMLDSAPKCPSCHFVPSKQPASATARALLDNLDERLDYILQSWHTAVLAGLQSDIATKSLANMTAEERKPVDAFLSQPQGDPVIPAGFTKSAGNALRGISAIAIEQEQLLAALRSGGLPCTVEQLEQRFSAFVAETMRNHDRQTTRVAIPAAEGTGG